MASGTENPYETVAELYATARPQYLSEVFDAIDDDARLAEHPAILEVGAGTGQATRQMTERGWEVQAIEPGAGLAAELVSASGSSVRVRNARFEDAPVEDDRFDLVAAATSWHWIDPTVADDKARRVLRPDGAIALFWNAHQPNTERPDWVPIRRAYLDLAPGLADLAPLTPDRADYDPHGEVAASGAFVEVEQHSWEFVVRYSAEEFVALIGTYASLRHLDVITLGELRDRLDTVINDELGGHVIKPYEALLVLARPRRGES